MENEKEKQALESNTIGAIPDNDVTAAGGLGIRDLKNLDWKKGAKIAAATSLGAAAVAGAAIGGKKLYDSHKKEDDDSKTMKYLNGLAYAYGDTSKENPLNND